MPEPNRPVLWITNRAQGKTSFEELPDDIKKKRSSFNDDEKDTMEEDTDDEMPELVDDVILEGTR